MFRQYQEPAHQQGAPTLNFQLIKEILDLEPYPHYLPIKCGE